MSHPQKADASEKSAPTMSLGFNRAIVSSAIIQDCASVEGLCCPLLVALINPIWSNHLAFRTQIPGTHYTAINRAHHNRDYPTSSRSDLKSARVSMAKTFSATLISLAFKNCCPITVTPLTAPEAPTTRTQKSVFINKTIRLSAFSTRAAIIYHRSELIKIKSKSNLFAFPSNTLERKKGNEAQCK